MKLVGKRKESNIPCEIQTTHFLHMISTMRTCFYMRAEDDREIADGKIAVGDGRAREEQLLFVRGFEHGAVWCSLRN